MSRISHRGCLQMIGVIAAALMLGACTLGQRLPTEPACTLIGCGGSLEVALIGEHVPTEFVMTVNSSEGDFVNVRCTDGGAEFEPPEAARWSPACPAGGVTFQNFTPAQITVTVSWSEGEVTQELTPAYAESHPNGPQCEPTCRSARAEVQIPDIPPYGNESTWKTYTDTEHGFSVKYPGQLQLEVGPSVNGDRVVFFGHQIWIQTSPDDPVVCRGDCPLIDSTETVTVAGREARRVQGRMGSMGGLVPQHFMLYLLRLGDRYVSFVLFAESTVATTDDPSYFRPLKEEDIDLFERMMRTVVFEK